MIKKSILLISIILMLMNLAFAQNDKGFPTSFNCPEVLENYNFLKSKNIKIESQKDKKKAIYEIILTAGIEYVITLCDNQNSRETNNMILDLLDQNDKLLISSYQPGNNKFYKKITFKCKITNTYSLGYSFENEYGIGTSSIFFQIPSRLKANDFANKNNQ